MFKKMYLMIAAVLLLGGCAEHFDPMSLPMKPVATSATSIKQVQDAAATAGNQPGMITFANQASVLMEQVHRVQLLQQQNYTAGVVKHDYSPSKLAALKLVPALWKLEYDSRALYFMAREAPPGFSAEGMAFAQQSFNYADLSATALALNLGYPISGIEWNASYLSTKHEKEMNAHIVQAIASAKKFDASAQRFIKHLSTVQASGGVIASLKPLDPISMHTITVSVIGKASRSDRDRLATALRAAAANMPPLPCDVSLTVNLSHLGGTFLPSRTVMILTGPFASEIAGNVAFSASVRLDSGKPAKLAVEMDAMQAKETDHLVVLAVSAILSRAAVTAYGEGWYSPRT